MFRLKSVLSALLYSAVISSAQEMRADKQDHAHHTVQFVVVDNGVKLEVLDWGGSGRPLVFLAGSGFDAHVFDEFAPKFTGAHHVYGITRRGFGASAAPLPTSDNYSANRLGDDVAEVTTSLHLDRPVLIGHSLAGEELSSVASRHPQLAAGLIYLDAAYSYAYYSRKLGDPIIDAVDLQTRLNKFLSTGLGGSQELGDLQEASAQLDNDLRALQKQRALLPPQPPRPADAPPPPPIPLALSKGRRKYTDFRLPILAIYADPHDFGQLYKDNPSARAALIENDRISTFAQADAFQKGIPSARVVRIPNADHFVFKSNEADVLREMHAFLAKLP